MSWVPHRLSPLPYHAIHELDKQAVDQDALIVDCSEHGGIEVCRLASLSVNPSLTPVIAVGPPSVDVEIKATGAGATSYLFKPATVQRVVAKVWQHHNITRRGCFDQKIFATTNGSTDDGGASRIRSLRLCADEHLLIINDTPIHLSPKQVHILRLFFENRGSIITRDRFHDVLWPNDIRSDAALTKHISNIVHLIRPHCPEEVIRNMRGVGYKFVGDGEVA